MVNVQADLINFISIYASGRAPDFSSIFVLSFITKTARLNVPVLNVGTFITSAGASHQSRVQPCISGPECLHWSARGCAKLKS